MFRNGAVRLLLLSGALCSAPELSAQRRSDDFLAAPLSPTAVFHASVVEDSSDFGHLDPVVIVRGPSGWWNARTGYDVGRADSLPAGVYAQQWTVGPWKYRLRLDERAGHFELFGHRIALDASNLILVTLGATPTDPIEVRTGGRIVVRVREGLSVTDALLAASAEIRAFISTSAGDVP